MSISSGVATHWSLAKFLHGQHLWTKTCFYFLMYFFCFAKHCIRTRTPAFYPEPARFGNNIIHFIVVAVPWPMYLAKVSCRINRKKNSKNNNNNNIVARRQKAVMNYSFFTFLGVLKTFAANISLRANELWITVGVFASSLGFQTLLHFAFIFFFGVPSFSISKCLGVCFRMLS